MGELWQKIHLRVSPQQRDPTVLYPQELIIFLYVDHEKKQFIPL